MHHLRVAVIPAALLLLLLASSSVHAASPEPSADSGDTRTSGEPPGFVGAPLLAVSGVLVIGLLAAGATIAYVRLSGGPGTAEASVSAPTGPGTRPTPSPLPAAAAGQAAGSTAVVDEARPTGPAIRQ